MKTAYFDCIAGASGDMILGALLDAGLPETTLLEELAKLRLEGFDLEVRRVNKNGFSATKVDVVIGDETSTRRLPEIQAIVRASDLPAAIKEKALAIFRRLGEVEAGTHGVEPDQMHLHELGGLDTIVDVAGALAGLAALQVERVVVSPLPLGRGFVQGAHGPIPLPAPATVALLKGVPITGSDLKVETVTPTGAALLTALAADFGPVPAMRLTAVGYGAGTRDLPIPNVLRLLLGEAEMADSAITETLIVLETNIDDLNPEIYEYVMERLFAAGALDVFLTPIQMKKNRPGTLVSALCRPGDVDALSAILYAETSTLGIRRQMVSRHCLPRTIETVQTPYGPVRVKVARWGDGQAKVAPEYEDCRRLAVETGVALREVYRAAEQAAAIMPVDTLAREQFKDGG